MKIESEKTVSITIKLTKEEARNLISIVQNPACSPELEPIELATLRIELFKRLKQEIE